MVNNSHGKRMVREDLIKQIEKNKEAIAELIANQLTAGTGIEIEDNEVSVDEAVVALKSELPAAVVANPTLAGTEAALTGLQVGNTKYALGGGPELIVKTLEVSGTINYSAQLTDEEFALAEKGCPIYITNTKDTIYFQKMDSSSIAYIQPTPVIYKTSTTYASLEESDTFDPNKAYFKLLGGNNVYVPIPDEAKFNQIKSSLLKATGTPDETKFGICKYLITRANKKISYPQSITNITIKE